MLHYTTERVEEGEEDRTIGRRNGREKNKERNK
jgi:hypothetical protein